MEHAQCRNHRGCMIVEFKTPILRRKRYAVWKAGQLVGDFSSVVLAELSAETLVVDPDPRG